MQVQFPLILDGATGTELQKRGFTGAVSAEEWVLAHPESILDIQRRYVDAGSRVLYAPSFGANRQKLEEHGIFNQTAAYNRRLAALSKQAAAGGRRPVPYGAVSLAYGRDLLPGAGGHLHAPGGRAGGGRGGPVRY